MLGKKFSIRYFKIFNIFFFSLKMALIFHANKVLETMCMKLSNLIFWEKIEKKIASILLSAEFASRVLKVNTTMSYDRYL